MKKYCFVWLSFVAISLVACSKREIELDEADPTMVKAITENLIEANATSKSEKVVLWNPGDEIAVFSGELSGKFESTLKKKPSSAAVFRGDLGLEAWPEEMDIWAVYPYSEEAFFDGETITTVLPSEQIARDGEFGKDMNLAIAHSNTSILQFYNVGGGIRFSVTEEGIKKVMFEGLGGEIISGKVKIGFSEDGLPEIRKVVKGSQFITILPPDGQETFQKDTWYYIVVIPGSLDRGYKLRFYKDSDYARKVSDNTLKIKRSFYRDLENADDGIEYEATTTHFPETDEDITQSVELTYYIGEQVTTLIESRDSDYNGITVDLLNKCKQVEGVLDAVINDSETILSILQKDSLWINILLNAESSLSDETRVEKRNSPDRLRKMKNAKQHSIDSNADKLAVILAPFQSDFHKDIDQIKDDLLFAGYKEENIHYLPDKDADILKFKGENLSRYSLIVIDTHGGIGYLAGFERMKNPRQGQMAKNQTILLSSTRYSSEAVLKYIHSGDLDWSEIAISKTEDSPWLLCMTPRFLYDSPFENTFVFLSACESAQIQDEGRGKGSMVWQFLELGAGVVSGYTESVNPTSANVCLTKMINFMSHGMSFEETKDYLMRSERMSKQNKMLYDANHEYKPLVYRDFTHFDIPSIYSYKQKSKTVPYHLFNPYPVLNNGQENFPVGKVMTLSWDCSLDNFSDEWEYITKINKKTISYYPEKVDYSIEYDLYLNDGYATTTSDKYVELTPQKSQKARWYVIAKIMEGETVIASYQSGEGSFIVTGETIPVNSISLDKSNLELTVGSTATLKATILPDNATNKNVSWSSSNPSVATVSSTGEVKGIAKGNATITVKTEDGGKTATCRVTVVETKIPVSGVSLNKSSLSMAVGDTQTLTTIVTPSNATDKSVTWSSSNTSVATVSSSGVVTAKKSGTAVITVKTNDGGKKATCNVTVKETSVGGDIEGTERDSWN